MDKQWKTYLYLNDTETFYICDHDIELIEKLFKFLNCWSFTSIHIQTFS